VIGLEEDRRVKDCRGLGEFISLLFLFWVATIALSSEFFILLVISLDNPK